MSEPRWPIFLLDGSDVAVVPNPMYTRGALNMLADRQGELYDALGRIVQIVVDAGQRGRRLLVRRKRDVRFEVISEVQHETRLRDALTRYLIETGRVIPEQADMLIFSSAAAELIRGDAPHTTRRTAYELGSTPTTEPPSSVT